MHTCKGVNHIKSIKKQTIRIIMLLLGTALIVVVGFILFKDRQYAFISMAIALLACIPFFLSFERNSKTNSKKVMILAVMVTLSVSGRFIFAFVPFLKPVTAIIIIYAIFFGPEMGFLCGALSALISNFYFGQGPWTPFQMFVWGFIGLLAGLLAKHLNKNRISLALFGVLAGFLFSAIMDIWVTVWMDGSFLLSRYVAALITGLPVTVAYAISNVVFLLVGIRPISKKLERIKLKYGL